MGKAENILVFGLPGRGKTHLLCAIARELILRHDRQVLFITAFHLVLGEQAPKIAALRRPETAVLWCALPLKIFYYLSYPFMAALNSTTAFLLRKAGIDVDPSIFEDTDKVKGKFMKRYEGKPEFEESFFSIT